MTNYYKIEKEKRGTCWYCGKQKTLTFASTSETGTAYYCTPCFDSLYEV